MDKIKNSFDFFHSIELRSILTSFLTWIMLVVIVFFVTRGEPSREFIYFEF